MICSIQDIGQRIEISHCVQAVLSALHSRTPKTVGEFRLLFSTYDHPLKSV